MAVFTKGLYNCACARTVCDWSCTTYATMMSGLVPNTVVGYVPPLKKTNADRIRAMTDEELAEYFSNICYDLWKMFVYDPKKMWLDWLKSPVEADNG